MSRRNYDKDYEYLLPEYFPVKLIGAFISVDFIVGCSFNCSFCISKRHPSRFELFAEGMVLDSRVSARKAFHWVKSLPSYRAGVQIRIGHDTDAGLEFDKAAQFIEKVDDDRSIVYLTRKPFTSPEVDFFKPYRKNLLLKLTATPRSASLAVERNPLALIRSAVAIDPRMLYWVVGPLVKDSIDDAKEILDALPRGSSLFLKRLNSAGLPHLDAVPLLSDAEYAMLESYALERGHIVTEWFCKNSLSRIGKGFFDVDKISAQPDAAKRERELAYCHTCDSNTLCHTELNMNVFRKQLDKQLDLLGLHLLEEPKQIGKRSFEITVQEPSSRGEETYLNHALDPAVSITISTREQGRSQGGSFCNIQDHALKRWYENGFFPVVELNNVAEYVLRDIRRMFSISNHEPRHFDRNRTDENGGSSCA